MIRPNKRSPIIMNLRAKGKQYTKNEEMCYKDSCEGERRGRGRGGKGRVGEAMEGRVREGVEGSMRDCWEQ